MPKHSSYALSNFNEDIAFGFILNNLKRIDNNFKYYIEQASTMVPFFLRTSGNIGFRPNLSSEAFIASLVRKCGFGKFILDKPEVTVESFEESVNKTIQRTTSDKVSLPRNKKRFLKALKLAHKMCKFPKKKFRPTSVRFSRNSMNMAAGSGFGYTGRKGTNMEKILVNTEIALREENPFISKPMTLAYRLQLRVSECLTYLKVKVRTVFMYSAHLTCIEGMFALPFITHFLKIDSPSDCFYTIGSNGLRIGQLLKHRLTARKGFKHYSLDIEGFDDNSPNWLILGAFSIIRSQLYLNPTESKHFNSMCCYFCSSPVLYQVRNKTCYLKGSGLPSGSWFTNLIGTLVHLIIMCYIDSDTVTNNRFLLCSDDNIFSSPLDLSYYTDAYSRIFGYTLSITKCKTFGTKGFLHFLGFDWDNYERIIDPYLCINQMIHHSQFRTDLTLEQRVISRSASILLNGKDGIIVFKRLFPEVYNLAVNSPDNTVFYEDFIQFKVPSTSENITGIHSSSRQSKFRCLKTHLLIGYLIR